jgi:hypothetical protein
MNHEERDTHGMHRTSSVRKGGGGWCAGASKSNFYLASGSRLESRM